MDNEFPEAFKPYYEHEPNKPIDLYSGGVSFIFEGRCVHGTGRVYHNFFPTQGTKIDIYSGTLGPLALALSSKIVDVELKEVGFSLKVRILNASFSTDTSALSLVGIVLPQNDRSGEKKLKGLTFHFANLPQLMGGSFVKIGTTAIRGRINLTVGEWEIYLDPLKSIKSALKSIKENSGFALTYCGHVYKKDDSEFLPHEVEDLLTNLGYLFTFALGHWTYPILYVGFSLPGNACWFDWTARRVGKWSSSGTWFDDTEATRFNQLLHGISDRRRDPIWCGSMSKFLHWYIESQNNITMESAAILLQAALELYCWILLVEEGKQYDPQKFDEKNAATKIRLLLKELRVPLKIPPEFSHLTQLCSDIDGRDGPGVFTKVRNSTVHPRNRNTTQESSDYALYECRQLGLWYFELALLKLFGFTGNYFPRYLGTKHVGLVKSLPWVDI
ncbi:MAG: hypothetical protein AB7N80_04710 [Bdellovibrionales bacterium]